MVTAYLRGWLLFILVSVLFLFLPSVVSADCVIPAGVTCVSSTDCASGQQKCTGTDSTTGATCSACRSTTAATEQTCSLQYNSTLNTECATGSSRSLVCGTTGAPAAPNCYNRVNCASGSQCSGLRSGLDAGCNYCVTPVLPTCTCPVPSTVACGTTSTTPTNSPCTGSCHVVGTSCPTNQTCTNGVCQSSLPTCSLSADLGTVVSGGSTTLRWTTTNSPTTCTASGSWVGNKTTSGGSESTGTLTNTTSSTTEKTYSLTCYTLSGTAGPACSTKVKVDPISCGACTVTCGGGTRSCSDGTNPACNTQSCSIGSCKVESASSTGTTSGTATASVNGFDRIDWKLNDAFNHTTVVETNLQTNFSNLTANTTYRVTAVGWCQNCTNTSANCTGNPAFTTSTTPTPLSGSLVCLRGSNNCGTGDGYWYNGWPAATTQCNFPGGTTANVTDQYRVGGKCWVPTSGGSTAIENSVGVHGRYLLRNAEGSETYPPVTGSNSIYPIWWWIFHSNLVGGHCILQGTINGTPACLQPDLVDGTINGRHYVGNGDVQVSATAPVAAFYKDILQLYQWPPQYEPIGYYTYQSVVVTRSHQNGICRDSNCTGGRQALYCDPNCGGPCGCSCAACEVETVDDERGCRLLSDQQNPPAAKYSVRSAFQPLSGFVRNQMNTVISYCHPAEEARIDLVFKNIPKYKCNMGNPINYVCELGTVNDPYSTSNCDGLCVTPRYSISGNVKEDTGFNNCRSGATNATRERAVLTLTGGPILTAPQQSINPSGAGNYSFSDLLAGTYAVTIAPVGGTAVGDTANPFSIAGITVGPDAIDKNFCISLYAPWIQVVGDMHSQTRIDLPPPPRLPR